MNSNTNGYPHRPNSNSHTSRDRVNQSKHNRASRKNNRGNAPRVQHSRSPTQHPNVSKKVHPKNIGYIQPKPKSKSINQKPKPKPKNISSRSIIDKQPNSTKELSILKSQLKSKKAKAKTKNPMKKSNSANYAKDVYQKRKQQQLKSRVTNSTDNLNEQPLISRRKKPIANSGSLYDIGGSAHNKYKKHKVEVATNIINKHIVNQNQNANANLNSNNERIIKNNPHVLPNRKKLILISLPTLDDNPLPRHAAFDFIQCKVGMARKVTWKVYDVLVLITPNNTTTKQKDAMFEICKKAKKNNKKLFVCVIDMNASESAVFRAKCFKLGANMVTNDHHSLKKVLNIIGNKGFKGRGKYVCPYCHAGNLSEDDLWYHVPLYHVFEAQPGIVRCPICSDDKKSSFLLHLRNCHGPVARGQIAPAYRDGILTHAFALVVVRRPSDNKFLVVQEANNSGFWLPGGRVAVGETLIEAAIRETKEEAGMEVDIKGILKVEHSTYAFNHRREAYNRMRVIFYAEPKSDNLPKSVPNYDSAGATFMDIEELDHIQLRAVEPREWFKKLSENFFYHSLDVLSCWKHDHRSSDHPGEYFLRQDNNNNAEAKLTSDMQVNNRAMKQKARPKTNAYIVSRENHSNARYDVNTDDDESRYDNYSGQSSETESGSENESLENNRFERKTSSKSYGSYQDDDETTQSGSVQTRTSEEDEDDNNGSESYVSNTDEDGLVMFDRVMNPKMTQIDSSCSIEVGQPQTQKQKQMREQQKKDETRIVITNATASPTNEDLARLQKTFHAKSQPVSANKSPQLIHQQSAASHTSPNMRPVQLPPGTMPNAVVGGIPSQMKKSPTLNAYYKKTLLSNATIPNNNMMQQQHQQQLLNNFLQQHSMFPYLNNLPQPPSMMQQFANLQRLAQVQAQAQAQQQQQPNVNQSLNSNSGVPSNVNVNNINMTTSMNINPKRSTPPPPTQQQQQQLFQPQQQNANSMFGVSNMQPRMHHHQHQHHQNSQLFMNPLLAQYYNQNIAPPVPVVPVTVPQTQQLPFGTPYMLNNGSHSSLQTVQQQQQFFPQLYQNPNANGLSLQNATSVPVSGMNSNNQNGDNGPTTKHRKSASNALPNIMPVLKNQNKTEPTIDVNK